MANSRANIDLSKFKRFVRSFSEGEVIAREGQPSTGWYILLSGRVGVFKRNLQIAEFTKTGTIFGELSTILDLTRTATLKALTLTEVIYIDADLNELIANHPDITRKVIINLAERLVKTTEDLSKRDSR